MKKIFVLLALAFVLAACDNGDMEKGPVEPNPYPDGVYPFEVSNITHEEETVDNRGSKKYTITWDNPDDKDFRRVECGAFYYDGTNTKPLPNPWYTEGGYEVWSFVLDENRITMISNLGNDKHLIIKCVDRFGNISKGERYNLPYLYD